MQTMSIKYFFLFSENYSQASMNLYPIHIGTSKCIFFKGGKNLCGISFHYVGFGVFSELIYVFNHPKRGLLYSIWSKAIDHAFYYKK